MLGVCLRKHHQFDIGRVAPEPAERRHQIIDLIVRQGKPPLGIGARQGGMPVMAERNHPQRARRAVVKQPLRVDRVDPQRFGHSIVQQSPQSAQLLPAERGCGIDEIQRASLEAAHGAEPADVSDVGGLARPGRYGTQPRGHEQRLPALGLQMRPRTIGQQFAEQLEFRLVQWLRRIDEMNQARGNAADARVARVQLLQEFIEAKLRQRGRAEQTKHGKF